MTVGELAAWRAANRAFTLVDVREPWELQLSRLEFTIDIPLGELPARRHELPSDRPLVIMCHHGMRSAQAVLWLQSMGYSQVINLAGGIDAWSRDIDGTIGVY